MASAQAAQGFTTICDLVLKNGHQHLASIERPKPVVYSSAYNISFLLLEKLHPFDPCKYAKVLKSLKQEKLIDKVRVSPEVRDCMHPVTIPLCKM
jgi:hypothetical protein